MIIIEIGLVLACVLAAYGVVQWKKEDGHREKQRYILDYARQVSDMESEQRALEKQRVLEEEQKQKTRVFGLDFMITHGSAFGGCSATLSDGRMRKGKVILDQILMYGKHPSGKEFTYYIEEQGLEICATEEEDTLMVRSTLNPFEIREAGMGRDQGVSVKNARIKAGVLYYIILESKHEITIKASKKC